MTPNNILNMAMLKELDIIAITDHNSTKQLPVIFELAESYDYTVIPACEVTVKEKFDVLCFFNSLSEAISFGEYIEAYLPKSDSNSSYENQVITDIYDMPKEFFNRPLKYVDIDYFTLVKIIRKYNGVIVLAHVDRPSSSVLNSYNLKDIEFDSIEIQSRCDYKEFINKFPEVNDYRVIVNSDSHTLLSISEKEHFLKIKDKSLKCILDYLKGESNE